MRDHPDYEARFYVELPEHWALYLTQRRLAAPTDRRCVVDVTERLAGRWKTLSPGSRLLQDLHGWSDGAISKEGKGRDGIVYTMWVDGLPYTAYRRLVLREDAA